MREFMGGVLGAMLLLSGLPAAAGAAATVSIEGSTIVLRGDDGPNKAYVFPVENGAQAFEGVEPGPGCRVKTGGDGGFDEGDVECPLDGITGFSASVGGGNDELWFQPAYAMSLPVTADMGPGDDLYDLGSSARDVVQLGDGADRAVDAAGHDVYFAGPGDDTIYGLEGGGFFDFDEEIHGGEGNDLLDGKDGNDNIDGGPGNDSVQGSAGDDTLAGGDGNDVVDPGPGNDVGDGGPGDDGLTPSLGNDTLTGGDGHDLVTASILGGSVQCAPDPGDDVLDGGPGDDRVCGGPGADAISGGDGQDLVNAIDEAADAGISCGGGADTLWADTLDPVALDCEHQAQPEGVRLRSSRTVRVPVACPDAGCSGRLTLTLAPGAPAPEATRPPDPASSTARPRRLRLGSRKVRLRRATQTLSLRLERRTLRRLRRLGERVVEARAVLTVPGAGRFVVRKTFPLQPPTVR